MLLVGCIVCIGGACIGCIAFIVCIGAIGAIVRACCILCMEGAEFHCILVAGDECRLEEVGCMVCINGPLVTNALDGCKGGGNDEVDGICVDRLML